MVDSSDLGGFADKNANLSDSQLLRFGDHRIEQEVQQVLLSDSSLSFSTLVVRRIADGVCLEGVLEVDATATDVGLLARQVAGVEHVLNHLVVHQRYRPPPKG
jgi:osmotically-inducible protein OsmY